MNEDAKKILRAGYLPLDIKVFTKQTQDDFKNIVGIAEAKDVNEFLKLSAARAGLLYMLNSEIGKPQNDFDIELLEKDLKIIEVCINQPVEIISEGNSWRTIEFFEDFSVLVTDSNKPSSMLFYDNYYQYIFVNIWRISFWIHNQDSYEAKESFKKYGLTFLLKENQPIFEYTQEFKDGLFLDSCFKLKI